MIYSLGFRARVNHYVGALWFYELTCVGQQYASATVTFSGSPDPNLITQIILGTYGHPSSDDTTIEHLNLIGDTTESLATAFALLLNDGYTAVWAQASGSQLTIYSRAMGMAGKASPYRQAQHRRLRSYYHAFREPVRGTSLGLLTIRRRRGRQLVHRPGSDAPLEPRGARLEPELLSGAQRLRIRCNCVVQYGTRQRRSHPPDAGIAQRYPDQTPALLNTPSLQTNFSPTSASYWQQVYLDMATVMTAAGLMPYLQFGEVQWWYFPNVSVITGGFRECRSTMPTPQYISNAVWPVR